MPAKYNDLFIELNRMELSSYDSLEHSTSSSDVGFIDQVYLIAILKEKKEQQHIGTVTLLPFGSSTEGEKKRRIKSNLA